MSGGLDSAQALIVTVRAMDRLGLPRRNVLGYSMPGFATTERTRTNALTVMDSLGITPGEIDIRPSCLQMLKDLRHPYAAGQPVYDLTFENVQAGERTSHLFRLANEHAALVVGTSDLSELALGWCTYGVGDQMSHYSVNASVPKTLIKYLVAWVISSRQFNEPATRVLQSILDTTISPELVPAEERAAQPAQVSETVIGPFECKTSFSITSAASAIGPVVWSSWLNTHGATARRVPGQRTWRRTSGRIRPRGHQALAGGVPAAFLRDEPVQEIGAPERTEGGLRRFPVAAE